MNSLKKNTRNAPRYLSRQRGASLLEGIAYLGIAAIVVLGAVSLLTGAFSSAQSNRVSEEVISIRTGVKKLFMGESAGYGAAPLDAMMISAKVIPTTLTVTAGVINNAWGGTVAIAGATNQFTITYTLVPQDACISLISGASGWFSITAGGAAAILTFPAKPSDAVIQCAAPTNTIVWTSL